MRRWEIGRDPTMEQRSLGTRPSGMRDKEARSREVGDGGRGRRKRLLLRGDRRDLSRAPPWACPQPHLCLRPGREGLPGALMGRALSILILSTAQTGRTRESRGVRADSQRRGFLEGRGHSSNREKQRRGL